ncbi:MAG TPA: zinc finger Ran-binding domain-containing protein [Fimbriimonadaceae bacterium]|nr:zinc finger Ran-binding domain-containing protein [Fimbriimonadaceae bacterium]HRJ33398.1 zinc finger Ran-binding domain-containing protein [Fimbriimonadaceae bacterium]
MDPDGIIKLITTVSLLPILGLTGLILVRRMIDGELSAAVGLGGIIAMFGLFAVAITTTSPWIGGGVLVLAITLVVFFPFAENMLAEHEVEVMDLGKLEAAFQTVNVQKDNVAARFRLAELLAEYDLKLPAAVFAEQTLNGLSTVIDPIKNASMRDYYQTEESRARLWRRQAERHANPPIRCPGCKHMNPPTLIVCERCQQPHLLELIRQRRGRSGAGGRLVLAWIVIAILMGTALFVFPLLPSSVAAPVMLAAIAASGVVLYFLFAKRRIA